MRGSRASALAISTICRRDSGRSLTSAIGWMSVAPARASASSAMRRWARRSISPNLVGGLLMRDVVGDREVGNERQLLEDADDAGAVGGGGRVEGDLRAVEHDAPGVGPDDAGQNLDQRRLAGAVLAEDRVNPPGGDGEISLLQRAHAAVALRHALHAQDRGARLHSRHSLDPRADGMCGARRSPRRASVTCFPSSGP